MSAADTPAHLLVVDDDARIRDLLRRFLMRNGYLVSTARDAAQARSLLRGLDFDLIVLDVMMPGEDGFALTRALRPRLTTPILLLTARGETSDRIKGLESGADDYLPKPFDPRELLLRINAILRRMPAPEPAAPRSLSLGALRYHFDRGELWRGEDLVHLTGTEAALLRRLAETPGEAVSRTALTESAGGPAPAPAAGSAPGPASATAHTTTDEAENSERAIDVQMTRLRRKIEDDPRQPRYLQTVRGVGYMLLAD